MGEEKGKIEREKKEERERKNLEWEALTFFMISRRLNQWLRARQDEKLIPTARAMRGSQFCGVSKTSRGKGFLLLVLFFG